VVVLDVDAGCRAVFLANRLRMGGIAQRSDVGRARVGREGVLRRAPSAESVVDDDVGQAGKHGFWHRCGLGQQ